MECDKMLRRGLSRASPPLLTRAVPKLFVHIPLRRPATARALLRRPAPSRNLRASPAGSERRMAHARALQQVRTSGIRVLAVAIMSRSCLTFSRFLPSRRNYEGYIPHRSTISLHTSYPSAPVTLSSPSGLAVSAHLTSSDAPQRSEEWFALRKDKLTTSTFSTALGFWKGNRRSELWYQKVFAPEADNIEASARAAMDWGVLNEPAAIERYKSITGRDVSFLGFAIHTEASFGWLGASPDGLLGCHPDGGILEVKCPYNKGKPELALPWQVMPYYYMPQIQGQMEIMDRDWVDLYCWTPNGSSLFRVYRDRAYWELMHGILYQFWWGSVVPARQALLLGKEEDAKAYEPKPKHELTGLIAVKSRKLAAEARLLCRDIGGHVEFFR